MEAKILEFISLSVETYKLKHGLSGKDALDLFERYGVLDFLWDGYSVLHTQSMDFVTQEIDTFLANRNYKAC